MEVIRREKIITLGSPEVWPHLVRRLGRLTPRIGRPNFHSTTNFINCIAHDNGPRIEGTVEWEKVCKRSPWEGIMDHEPIIDHEALAKAVKEANEREIWEIK